MAFGLFRIRGKTLIYKRLDHKTALKANNNKYKVLKYEGTQHGFHNDTTPRYDANAAKLSWDRSLAFFKNNLK